MTADHKDLKAAKDTVIAKLAALSRAADDAAIATAGFFSALDANVDTSKEIKDLATTLSILGASVKSIDERIPLLSAELGGKPIKKKIERDPNAPKKPLTAFFAYSATVRDKVRAERAAKGETSLSSVELTQIISEQWKALTDEQREDWKKKYHDELVGYNEAFDKYKHDKANGIAVAPKEEVVKKVEKEEKPSHHEGEKKKSKKRKVDEENGGAKEEKSEEKKKKKDKKKKKTSNE